MILGICATFASGNAAHGMQAILPANFDLPDSSTQPISDSLTNSIMTAMMVSEGTRARLPLPVQILQAGVPCVI